MRSRVALYKYLRCQWFNFQLLYLQLGRKLRKTSSFSGTGRSTNSIAWKRWLLWNKWLLKWSEKENNPNKQNFDGEGNWLGVVDFHCLQRSLVMSMRFIFGDDCNDAPYSPPFLDFRLFTHAFKSCNSETNRRNRNVVLNFFRLFLFLSV